MRGSLPSRAAGPGEGDRGRGSLLIVSCLVGKFPALDTARALPRLFWLSPGVEPCPVIERAGRVPGGGREGEGGLKGQAGAPRSAVAAG